MFFFVSQGSFNTLIVPDEVVRFFNFLLARYDLQCLQDLLEFLERKESNEKKNREEQKLRLVEKLMFIMIDEIPPAVRNKIIFDTNESKLISTELYERLRARAELLSVEQLEHFLEFLNEIKEVHTKPE